MGINQRIKREAKYRLSGRWPGALAATGIFLAFLFLSALFREILLQIFYGFSLLDLSQNLEAAAGLLKNPYYWISTGLSWLLSFFLVSPAFLGLIRYFFLSAQFDKGVDREEDYPSVAEVFYYFSSGKRFGSWLFYQVRLLLRSILWGLISFLPGLVIFFWGYMGIDFHGLTALENADYWDAFGQAFQSGILVLVGEILLLCGFVLYIPMMLRYFLAPFLLIKEKLPAEECFRLSVRMMKNYRGKIFSLLFSFFGWALLCVFAFPVLYVLPYAAVSACVGAKWLLRQEEQMAQQPPAPPVSFQYPSAPESRVSERNWQASERAAAENSGKEGGEPPV